MVTISEGMLDAKAAELHADRIPLRPRNEVNVNAVGNMYIEFHHDSLVAVKHTKNQSHPLIVIPREAMHQRHA